jgi:hypothetical protein
MPDFFEEEKMMERIKDFHETRLSDAQDQLIRNRESMEY